MKELKALNHYIFRYKWHFVLGAIFVLISNLFAIVPPKIISNMIDEVTNYLIVFNGGTEVVDVEAEGNFNWFLLKMGALILLFALGRGLFMFLMRQSLIVMSRNIEFDIRNDMYHHYQQLPHSFFKSNFTGDLMSRVSEDVNHVRMYLGPGILYFINLSSLIIFIVYTMVQINAELTFYVLIPLPFLSFAIYYINNIINLRSEKIQQKLSTLTSFAQESFSAIRVIKSYAQEKGVGAFFSDESNAYKEVSLSLARVHAYFFPLMILFVGLSTLLTLYIGGNKVINGEISPGNIVEFIVYINMLTWPVSSVGWVASMIQRASAAQKRINEFMEAEPLEKGDTPASKLQGKISFSNVGFTYPETGVKVFSNLNFEILKGQKIAVIGRTGAGKSTIAELLLKNYELDHGEIIFDNRSSVDLDSRYLKSEIAYIPQDPFLFSNTIASNINFGSHSENQMEEIRKVAQYAQIDEEIMAFPEGYETVVGERGVTLSGGQKQRISIARALQKDSNILIFDDSLSALDTKTEHAIFNHLNTVLENKTAIIITHRLHESFGFDNIIVIDEGEVVEQGKHNELLTLKGIYYDIFNMQQQDELSITD